MPVPQHQLPTNKDRDHDEVLLFLSSLPYPPSRVTHYPNKQVMLRHICNPREISYSVPNGLCHGVCLWYQLFELVDGQGLCAIFEGFIGIGMDLPKFRTRFGQQLQS